MQTEQTHLAPNNRTRRGLVATIVAALVLGGLAGASLTTILDSATAEPAGVRSGAAGTAEPIAYSRTVSSLTQLYKQVTPGVVDITVTTRASGGLPFAPGQSGQAEGTGFVYDRNGDILTAAHVVAGAASIEVRFQDGQTAKATLVGKDNSVDTAVVHVDLPPSRLHPLPLGDSTDVQPGQAVAAIGSPFGLTESITAGIVSATGRTIQAPNKYSISGAIQTDAPINHGNSGGPLLTTAGRVIGIAVQIDSQSGDNAGVGFAVPSNAAKSAADSLIAGRTPAHAYLGVQVGDGPGGTGATIDGVTPGSPAEKAGLRVGDIVTAVDGTPIANADDLSSRINADQPGQKITLAITRGGASRTIDVALGTRPDS